MTRYTPARLRAHRARYYRRLRDDALAAYGRACQCCGESDPRFLTIDHVNSDGAAHRRAEQMGTGTNTYLWLRRHSYPSGFRVLCFNCNCARHHNGGVCPHADPLCE